MLVCLSGSGGVPARDGLPNSKAIEAWTRRENVAAAESDRWGYVAEASGLQRALSGRCMPLPRCAAPATNLPPWMQPLAQLYSSGANTTQLGTFEASWLGATSSPCAAFPRAKRRHHDAQDWRGHRSRRGEAPAPAHSACHAPRHRQPGAGLGHRRSLPAYGCFACFLPARLLLTPPRCVQGRAAQPRHASTPTMPPRHPPRWVLAH